MTDQKPEPTAFRLTEDWLSVLIAFGLILLAALGVLGEGGIPINF
jgi:hypothetical protein